MFSGIILDEIPMKNFVRYKVIPMGINTTTEKKNFKKMVAAAI